MGVTGSTSPLIFDVFGAMSKTLFLLKTLVWSNNFEKRKGAKSNKRRLRCEANTALKDLVPLGDHSSCQRKRMGKEDRRKRERAG